MSAHAAHPPELIVARDAGALAALAADRIARELATLARARAEQPGATIEIAFAGGRTPRATYALLATDSRVPWPMLAVWLGDERAVAPDDPASNARLLHETLVEPGALRADQLHAPFTAAPRTHADVEDAASSYARRMPERFDLVLLGLGADGHVASLFPRSPALQEMERRCVPVRAPVEPVERITLTPPLVASAGALLVLVSGTEKAEAVARALEGEWDPRQTPGQLARHGTWIVDREAAGALRRTGGSAAAP
ncbi:MAG TPA: 6-phosphogluconolactonase [Planctomycetota bacterium]|nr:6-phosphogluconolactonase [Planctomycetota bacterium]